MDEYVPSDEQFGDEAPYEVNPNDFLKYIRGCVCADRFIPLLGIFYPVQA